MDFVGPTLTSVRDCTAGATGLVGSRLVSRLSAQGHTVRVLTRNPDKARGKLPYARVRFYNLQQQLQEALKGATGVVNLAGTVSVHTCITMCPSCDTSKQCLQLWHLSCEI